MIVDPELVYAQVRQSVPRNWSNWGCARLAMRIIYAHENADYARNIVAQSRLVEEEVTGPQDSYPTFHPWREPQGWKPRHNDPTE